MAGAQMGESPLGGSMELMTRSGLERGFVSWISGLITLCVFSLL
jgi:hypothetical protein